MIQMALTGSWGQRHLGGHLQTLPTCLVAKALPPPAAPSRPGQSQQMRRSQALLRAARQGSAAVLRSESGGEAAQAEQLTDPPPALLVMTPTCPNAASLHAPSPRLNAQPSEQPGQQRKHQAHARAHEQKLPQPGAAAASGYLLACGAAVGGEPSAGTRLWLTNRRRLVGLLIPIVGQPFGCRWVWLRVQQGGQGRRAGEHRAGSAEQAATHPL